MIKFVCFTLAGRFGGLGFRLGNTWCLQGDYKGPIQQRGLHGGHTGIIWGYGGVMEGLHGDTIADYVKRCYTGMLCWTALRKFQMSTSFDFLLSLQFP